MELAKQHLRVDHDDEDDLIGFYIVSARELAEQYLARALLTQTLLWTVAQESPPGGWPLANVPVTLLVFPQWITPDMIGRHALFLPRLPVQSVTAVGIGRWVGTDTTLTADTQYGVNAETGQLKLFGVPGLAPGGHLSVEFVAGYGDKASAVPTSIRHAILITLAALYENRGDDGGDLPATAERLLSPYRCVTFGG